MKKPTKTILVPNSQTFYFDYVSNKVSIDYFNNWVKETVPKGATDVTLTIDEDYDDDGNVMSSYLVLAWKEKTKNTRYVSEMKKYEKWKKKCQK